MARISTAMCIGLAAAAVAGGCASDPLAPGRARQLALVSPAEQAKSIREYLGRLRADMHRPGFTYSARRSDGRAVTIEEDIALQEQALARLERRGGAAPGVTLSRSPEGVPGHITALGLGGCNGPVCGYSTFTKYTGYFSGSGTTDARGATSVDVVVKIEGALCQGYPAGMENTFSSSAMGERVSASGTLMCWSGPRTRGRTTSTHGAFVSGRYATVNSAAGDDFF